jgi:hypothetical protein
MPQRGVRWGSTNPSWPVERGPGVATRQRAPTTSRLPVARHIGLARLRVFVGAAQTRQTSPRSEHHPRPTPRASLRSRVRSAHPCAAVRRRAAVLRDCARRSGREQRSWRGARAPGWRESSPAHTPFEGEGFKTVAAAPFLRPLAAWKKDGHLKVPAVALPVPVRVRTGTGRIHRARCPCSGSCQPAC